MKEVSVRELRNRTGDLVQRVEDGETIVLTVHGRPVADIVPHQSRRESIPAAELFERFDVSRTKHPPAPQPRYLDDVTTDDVIVEAEDRRRGLRERD